MVIDPSLSLVGRGDLPRPDRILNSHCHEDHVAGNHLYPDVPWSICTRPTSPASARSTR